jgi:phage antirepressor YoqD-like protein
MYKVQSVLFNKNKINLTQAIEWLEDNNYIIKKVDATKSLYRFRQINPSTLKKEGYTNYRNHKINDDIMLVLVYKD